MVPCSGDGGEVAVAEGGGGGGHDAGVGGDPGDGAALRQPRPHPPSQGPGSTACSVQGVQGLCSCITGGKYFYLYTKYL